jgi:glycerophosphoryl diester phosphodiesterase
LTLVIAHRGAWGAGLAENTLAAFERAIELGCDMVELDVRRDADGVLVVAHDPPEAAGEPPRLAEALELCRGRIMVDVELKETGCVHEALALLDPNECLLSSFHEEVVRQARELAPRLRTGLIVDRAPSGDAGADYLVLERNLRPRAPCLMWTVNDHAELERFLCDPAVLGVITDVPELALELRSGLSGRTEPAAPR